MAGLEEADARLQEALTQIIIDKLMATLKPTLTTALEAAYMQGYSDCKSRREGTR